MADITVGDIKKITKGKLLCGNEYDICENFCIDSREIKSGDVFVGIKGERVNGNELYEEVLKKGAKCLILENVEIPEDIIKKYTDSAIIIVEDTIKALQQIAEYKRNLYKIPVIAITGSVGKTSTKDIVAEVVSKKYKVLKTQGNLNNHIGLPLTILSLKDEEAMVVELGMSHLGEISTLTKIAKPTIAIITNVGTAHIGNLGSRENILKAKMEIIEGLQNNGTLIINNDNDLLHKWNLENNHKINVITYGIQNKSNVMAYNIQQNEKGSTFNTKVEEQEYNVKVKIGGEHFVYNSLCAIAVGLKLGINIGKILEGILDFKLTEKRMEMFTNDKGILVINDCYNANYDSMKAAIEYLAKLPNKRKIAILGDMLELGEYSKQLHEKVGEEINKNKIDVLITVGEEAKNISKIAQKTVKEIYNFEKNEQAIKLLQTYLQKEDAVLIKASNGMNFTEISAQLETVPN